MKKILLIASFSDSILQFRGDLINAWLSAGYSVSVAAPKITESGVICRALAEKGVNVYDIALSRNGLSPTGDLKSLVGIYRLIKRVQPDIVFAYTVKPVIYGILAAYFAGVKYKYALITGLGYSFQNDGRRRGVKALAKIFYKISLAKADKVFFQNPDDEALFRSTGVLGQTVPSSVLNGSGVNLTHYRVLPVVCKEITFLMIARLLGDKGVREYVAVAETIRKNFKGVKFELAGWIDDGPDSIKKEELADWISRGIIVFHGRVQDVRPLLSASSIYVLPSYREGTPRTVLEAMASGRAIITTDAPGCRETVVEGKNGFLVPIKDSMALEAAMLKFIRNPLLVHTMGAASREIVERKYDVDKVNAHMMREMELV